jgi:hypothetical protein
MPFHNEDLIQRSVTFKTEPVEREPKGDWVDNKLQERGGREAWLAHHLVFLHLFLRESWDPEFHTQHRLAHLEQSLVNASKILRLSEVKTVNGIPHVSEESQARQETRNDGLDNHNSNSGGNSVPAPQNLGSVLKRNQSVQVISSDWVLQGISAYIQQLKAPFPPRFFAADIVEWIAGEEEFETNDILSNARKLGRYMSEHGQILAGALGIHFNGMYNNRVAYKYTPKG